MAFPAVMTALKLFVGLEERRDFNQHQINDDQEYLLQSGLSTLAFGFSQHNLERHVVDADIQSFFDNVNHGKLMKLVEQRISDRRILKLIGQWLKAGILYGNIPEVSELGTSQGSVISPLLANIYLNTLDRLWEKYGLTHGKLVRYADDSVIICKNKKSANHALELLKYIMGNWI